MWVRLRYLAHELDVPLGQFVIGRSAECQLSLEDPLVSRRHALLTVRADGLTVEDLGSRNGVLVNGVHIEGAQPLEDGDRIVIGGQELSIVSSCGAREPFPTALPDDEVGHEPAMRAEDLRDDEEDSTRIGAVPIATPNADKRVNALSLIGGVADKALAMGRAEEAARILQRSLDDILAKARAGDAPDPEIADRAASYASRLAGATGRGEWLDYIVELYTLLGRLLPAPVVDELYTTVRRVRSIDLTRLRAYIGRLADAAEGYGPTERFLLQRIEGLERLGALK